MLRCLHVRAVVIAMTRTPSTPREAAVLVTTAVSLPGDYSDPRDYVLDLLFTAYAPAALEVCEAGCEYGWLCTPEGIAALQRAVAEDPRANVPGWLRGGLLRCAATVGGAQPDTPDARGVLEKAMAVLADLAGDAGRAGEWSRETRLRRHLADLLAAWNATPPGQTHLTTP